MKKKQKKQDKVFDTLTLLREVADGQVYEGSRGRYCFIMQSNGNGRLGFVQFNKRFMTGIFRPKFSEEGVLYFGDYEGRILKFARHGDKDMVIFDIGEKHVPTKP